jgi:hypothetical protein
VARVQARAPRSRTAQDRDRVDPNRTTNGAPTRHPEEPTHPLAPPVRQQPAQDLATLWTFLTVPGVEPTNNPAERALRAPVIHRKVSLGTQSKDGERFAERALSAAATCRLQTRSLFTYLSELLVAHSRGDPFPALA